MRVLKQLGNRAFKNLHKNIKYVPRNRIGSNQKPYRCGYGPKNKRLKSTVYNDNLSIAHANLSNTKALPRQSPNMDF